jgi:uncharacterized protein (DUF736 family)
MSETKQKNGKASDLTDLGAFWKKEKNGKQFLSGKVKIGDGEFTAFIFKNNKTKPNQPDYRLTLADLPESLKPDVAQKNNKPSSEAVVDSENQDDIPF